MVNCDFGLPFHFVVILAVNRSRKRGKRRQKRGSEPGSRMRKKKGAWPNSELGCKGSMRKSRRGNGRNRKRFLICSSLFEALVLTQFEFMSVLNLKKSIL